MVAETSASCKRFDVFQFVNACQHQQRVKAIAIAKSYVRVTPLRIKLGNYMHLLGAEIFQRFKKQKGVILMRNQ